MPTILELESISFPAEDSVVVVTDTASSKKITISDLRNTMVRTASPTVAGAVKVGSGLSIDPAGTLSVTNFSGYTLPKATNATLGGVIVGAGLTINSQGVLSLTNINVPVASRNNFGTVKVGDGLLIEDGVLSNAVSQYELPTASATVLGGVKIGPGLSIENSIVSTKARPYATEADQTITEDYHTGSASVVYSVSPLTIDRSATVTVGANTTWVLYTPGVPLERPPIPVPVEADNGIFLENYTMPEGKKMYSIAPVSIDRNVTVTVGKTTTWVVYTPAVPTVIQADQSSSAIQESSSIISSNYTITEGMTARSFGTITVDKNVTVTISSLSTWIIF